MEKRVSMDMKVIYAVVAFVAMLISSNVSYWLVNSILEKLPANVFLTVIGLLVMTALPQKRSKKYVGQKDGRSCNYRRDRKIFGMCAVLQKVSGQGLQPVVRYYLRRTRGRIYFRRA